MAAYSMLLEFLNINIGDVISSNDDDGSIPQLYQGAERQGLTEVFDDLDIHISDFDYGGISFDPLLGCTLPPSNVQSWQPMRVPANSMTHEMPFPNSRPTVDTSVEKSYGRFEPHLLASAGVCLYSPSQGIAPIGTLITDQSNSLAYLGTFSPSTSSSPSETSMAEDNVFSELEYQNDDISSPSPSAASCSSSSSIPDARRFASTRASHSDGAYRPLTEIATTAHPPAKFGSKASRGNKRRIDVSEFEDLSLCYHDEEDNDIESSDEDEYQPESGEDSDLDARSRRSFTSSKRPSPRVPMFTDYIQPLAKANRSKNHSSSKPKGPAAKKVFLNDGHTNAVGGFVCGLITQWKGKGGQYTSKGIRTPEVGEVCQMRTRNWSDMIRHQEKTFWHSPPGVCQSCQSSLNGRQDNLHRHGLAACKGPMKGKKVSSKRPSKKARK